MDDSCIRPTFPYVENVDYMSKNYISQYHLSVCWRQNNSVTIKTHLDDICLTIPSTISRRLENIAWRRWFKQLQNLDEVSPAKINWNKCQDITWLYGPKYLGESQFDLISSPLTTHNLSKLDYNDYPELELDVSSVESGACSINFDDISLISSLDDAEETEDFHLKPALKPSCSNLHSLAGPKNTKRKLVKFSYIVNSREFINDILFDYDFLDTLCL